MAERFISATPITPLPEGVFLLPVCTDRLRFHMMLSALDRTAQDERDTDYLADYLNAQQYVADPTKSPCLSGLFNVTWERSGCFIQFFVNGVAVTGQIDICAINPSCDNSSSSSEYDEGEGDDMPVQGITFDCKTKELVVNFGGCNPECRIDLSCLGVQQGLPDSGYTPPGGGTGNDEYFACGKAYAAVRTVMQMAESIWNHCDDITLTPWKEIQEENPGVDIRKSPDGWTAMGYALIGKLALMEWGDQADQEQLYLCQAAEIFTNTADDDLADDQKFEQFRSIFRGSFLGNFVWGSYFDYIIGGATFSGEGVIGRKQLQEISVANAGDDTRDCSCPEAVDPEQPNGYGWVYSYDFTAGLSDWTLTDLIRDTNGIYDNTPTGQYLAVNGTAEADPLYADGTTLIKYAAIYWNAPAGWGKGVNPRPLFLAGTPSVTLIPATAWGGDNLAPGAGKAVWADVDGEGMAAGTPLSIGIDGYNWYNGAEGGPLYITRVVIAGDGTPPYTAP